MSQGHPTAQAVTSGPGHHFFGYYDKCPWDASGRYMLGLETTFMDRPPTPDDTAVIGLIDTASDNRWEPIAETRAWNWQQGTMLRWLPSAPDRLIIYIDREEDRFISVIRDVRTGDNRKLPRPVYAVSHDGRSAVTLNFARLHRTAPGYGYVGLPDHWAEENCPDKDGIYWMDLTTGEERLIISLAQIARIGPNPTMEGVEHWFNHLLFNSDDSRFLFLHRWRRPDGGWFTRMFAADPDGSNIYCVSDHEMVSHFDWLDERRILAWARRHEIGDRYFLFTDRAEEREIIGEAVLTTDGHCSYSPDRHWILTDTYPDHEDMRSLLLYRPADGRRVDIGRFFSPSKLKGEIRCDLHPRWSRDGRKVCFDSAHEGSRQMYVVDVGELISRL